MMYVHDFVRAETSYSLTAELPKKQHTVDSTCILVTVITEKKKQADASRLQLICENT